MSAQIVPLPTDPNQKFAIALAIDGGTVTLQLAVSYSTAAGYWVLAIADQFGNPILASLPMITGYYPAANLLKQYRYLGIGSAYIINASGVPQDSPDATNLGTDFVLLWDDTPTI